MINGVAHGPEQPTTCQLHMRSFSDGDVIDIEPWRAEPFPVIKDLVVDRSAFDRIIQAGGYISAPTGTAPTPRPSRAEDECRRGVRCGHLHRVRCLRSGLPERVGDAVHRGQGHSSRPVAAGSARGTRACSAWWRSKTKRVSGAARTSVSAPRSARRAFRSRTISRLNRDLFGALAKGKAKKLTLSGTGTAAPRRSRVDAPGTRGITAGYPRYGDLPLLSTRVATPATGGLLAA